MDEDPVVQRLREIWETAENPVTAAVAQLTHAMVTSLIELRQALATQEVDDRLEPLADARMAAALAAMERIPQERWDRWCEVPKQTLIRRYRDMIVRAKAETRLHHD